MTSLFQGSTQPWVQLRDCDSLNVCRGLRLAPKPCETFPFHVYGHFSFLWGSHGDIQLVSRTGGCEGVIGGCAFLFSSLALLIVACVILWVLGLLEIEVAPLMHVARYTRSVMGESLEVA